MARLVSGTFTGIGRSPVFYRASQRSETGDAKFNSAITGTFVGSVQLERRNGPSGTWVLAATARTAPDTFNCTEPSPDAEFSFNCTAYTSGTIAYEATGYGSIR